MGTKLVITIDTEPDNQWDLSLRRNLQFKNISELSMLQGLFDKYKAMPTYLTTFSVVKSDVCSVLKDIAKSTTCEIGSHLHAWDTPPFISQIRGDGTYLYQYSFDVQSQKMANLDGLITETFGFKPVSYRGGRYSFDKDTISILYGYRYLVDTSVTSGISWENDGGTNFKKWPYKDYFLQTEDDSNLLEVPISIKIKTKFPRFSKFLHLNLPNWTHAEGILRRVADFNIIWLDPSFNSYEDMKWASDALLEEGVSCLNVMFHSSVIVPGGAPYSITKEDTVRFFENLERLLDYLIMDRKLEPITLKDFYNYRKDNSLDPSDAPVRRILRINSHL